MFGSAASQAPASQVYVDDVFSAYTYTGNNSTLNIVNGIDLAGQGGMVWGKRRDSSTLGDHSIVDTVRGRGSVVFTNQTLQAYPCAAGYDVTSFNSNGFSLGPANNGSFNTSGASMVAWTFRNADKFHGVATVTKSSGSNATASFANLGTLGMVRVKRTDATGSWYVWHKDLSAGQLLIGETTAAAATLGHITVSGTTVTLVSGVVADGTYLVEAFAHDAGASGIIQCGSFTTDGSGNATVTLGWEPQFAIIKRTDSTGSWYILDVSRGWSQATDEYLLAQSAGAAATADIGHPLATGFGVLNSIGASSSFAFVCIRRPNKPPTSGAQVYNAVARTGNGAAASVTGVGFAPDAALARARTRTNINEVTFSRLRGANQALYSNATTAESTNTASLTSFDVDGITLGSDGGGAINGFVGDTYINWLFRRAPGFLDEVCYAGTGANGTQAHNLGVAPELAIYKRRDSTTNWSVYHAALGPGAKLLLDTTAASAADATIFNNTAPTASVFTLGAYNPVNASGGSFVAYLFATLAGISKVGSYTGNGTSQTINCGFSTGARFILAKRTDAAGDWFVFDTVRGIVSANDPHLSLNTAAAEVTGDDTIDPDTSGFIVNQVAATNLNVTSATYIFLAIA